MGIFGIVGGDNDVNTRKTPTRRGGGGGGGALT